MRKMTRFAAVAVLVTVGCFSDDPDDGDLTGVDLRGDTLVEIRMVDNAFEPRNVTIDRGTTVRWISTTGTFHTITPEGHSAWQRFTSNAPSDTFEAVLQNAGEFPYFCEPHQQDDMVGSIEVQ